MSGPASIVDGRSAVPLRWWTQSRLDAAAGRLEQALRAWSCAWGGPHLEVRATNAAGEVVPVAAVRLAGGQAQVVCPGRADEALHGVLFDADVSEPPAGPTMAQAVAAEAWQDLLSTIANFAPAPTVAGPCPAPWQWSGALRFDVLLVGGGARGFTFTLHISPTLADLWCAPEGAASSVAAAPAREALTPPELAVAERRVRVDVHLAPLVMELGALRELQLGDVIALPHDLDDAVDLSFDAGGGAEPQGFCRAYLGQRGGYRAVVLVARSDTHRPA